MCDEDEVSTMDVRVRMGDAIDPFQLANGFEAVIGYECQERSNPPLPASFFSPNSKKKCQVGQRLAFLHVIKSLLRIVRSDHCSVENRRNLDKLRHNHR